MVVDDVRDVMILVLVLDLVLVLVNGEGLLDLRDRENWQGWGFIDEGAIALFLALTEILALKIFQ